MDKVISWSLMCIGILGFLTTFPLWLKEKLDNRAMIGITLVLSWAALWYTAYLAIQQASKG